MMGQIAPKAPEASVFVCRIGGPPGNDGGVGGNLRTLIEAADMMEASASVVPAVSMSVAVTSLRLDPARHFDEALHCLSGEEIQRAERFFKNADRDRYVLAHAMLRILLARRLAVAPAEIDFAQGPHGKPCLAGSALPVAFNLSYGDGLAALAFARRPVGIDIEAVRDDLAFSEIVHRFFQSDELSYLESGSKNSDDPGLHNRFFRLWTRKEAVLKALGVGLSGIKDLSVLPDLIVANAAPDDAMRILLQTLPGPPGHAMALAVETREGV